MPDTDYLFGEDDEPETVPAGAKGNPVAEQRKHIKELEARLKEVEPEYEQLKAFKAEYDSSQRETEIKAAFSELGLPESAVKFYKLENPEGEVSKEAAARWAVENQFASADQFTAAEPTDKGFVPTTHGESFVPGAKTYNRTEWEKLISDTRNTANVAEAQKALEEGRVDLQNRG